MSLALPLTSAEACISRSSSKDGLLEALLREQQLTAVERFAKWHERDTPPLQARHYHDLIPLTSPAAGEQYAFEVDLDSCSGCKACVVACHNLNGLEEEETWRSVGLLHGGTSLLPVVQHVTTACHHCLEPACLDGCPVMAYEKDPLTGIVRHLDDQCIGCQYCILKCPYDVPRYNPAKGIVRKCDLCSDRLAANEAPACVQACPNRAIRVVLVDRREAAENAEANLFLPGAPEPGYTLPTTVYKTKRPLPSNLLPADYYSAAPQHAHWPLVAMLVLTQMSVGAFAIGQAMLLADAALGLLREPAARGLHALAALVLGAIGIGASTFHLGRPWLAYRAIIGWRTSWLSREVICFGGFAFLASIYAALAGLSVAGVASGGLMERVLGAAVALSGLAGVACSVMVYASTRRVFWNPLYTGLKFSLTMLVLGIPAALVVSLLATVSAASAASDSLLSPTVRWLCLATFGAALIKLLAEAAAFGWLKARTFTPLKRTALLMTGDLAKATRARFVAGVLGGLLLPGWLAIQLANGNGTPSPALLLAIAAAMLVLNLAGELLERYLFFAAVVAPKMPGAPSA